MAQFNFNAAEHAGAQMNFEALPKGWYQAKLIESKVRQTNSGGQALDFVAEILAPAFAKGRKVFLGFNVVHPTSEDAVRIGFEQLASLSMAVQTPQWQQTEQLHEKPFHIKLKIEKAPEGSDYEDRNQPNGYDLITVNRALAVQPGAPVGAPTTAPFPGAAAPAPAAAPAAMPQPAAAPVAPPVTPAPVAPQAAPAAPAAAAPAQPWNNPQPWEQPAAAPVAPAAPAPAAEPQKSPEQIAWEQQQAAAAQAAAQPAPTPAPAQAAPAPTEAAPAPWAQQTATPAPQQPQAAQAAPAAAEPPHPAQAQVPPWQQPQA